MQHTKRLSLTLSFIGLAVPLASRSLSSISPH